VSGLTGITGTGTVGDQTRAVAAETYDSRRLSVSGGRVTRTRSWVVYARPGANTLVPSGDYPALATGVQYGQVHPEDATLRAVDVTSSPTRMAGRLAYDVTWTYRRVEIQPAGVPDDPEAPGYQEVNLDGEPQFLDAWRQQRSGGGWATAPRGDIIPPRTDVGGVPIDTGGRAGSFLVRVGSYSIPRNYRLQDYVATQFLDAMGARNDAPFLGFETGALLYARPRSSRIEQGVVRVVHTLVLDEFFHCRQIAGADENGEVEITTPGGVIDGITYEKSHASSVFWIQPFPRLIDFQSINIVDLSQL